MKIKRDILFITIMIVLSFLLLTACTTEAPVPPASDIPAEASTTEALQEQPQEAVKGVEAAPEQEKPATTTPPESKPTEAEKSSEVTPKNTPEPSAAKPEDKASLQIEGSGIEKTITLALDDLKAMKDSVIEDDFFSLNSYGTKEYFHFKGIKLNAILQKAGLKKSAATITFIASDGYKLELTIEQALKEGYIDEQDPDKKYPVIIAWHENGKDYDAAKGYPFRLVLGQKEPGDVNKPQWVMNIARIIVN